MVPSPVPVMAVVMAAPLLLAHALAVSLHETAFAARRPCVAAGAVADRFDVHRGRRRGSRPVALVRRFALDRSGDEGEAAQLAGVVDLHRIPVLIMLAEPVAREEVGVRAVAADAQQARREGAEAGRDQLDAAQGLLADRSPVAEGEAVGLPLVCVFVAVQVAV